MTIKDLAATTGYAVGTVSRALNNHPNVSEKARRAILQAARESGFELNQNAKQLKQLHSTTILVIVKGTGNELFGEMLETIQTQLASTRYQLSVDYIDEVNNEVLRAVQLCREKKPLGVMFLGGTIQNFTADFDKIDVPSVVVTNDASMLHFDNLSSISTDDREAGRQAVQTLMDLGHRKIAIIGGDREVSDTSRLRFEGGLQAFADNGIPFDSAWDCKNVRFSYQAGYKATLDLLAQRVKFTAVFAVADVVAIGVIRALRENNLRVPEDVSVIGMDGLPLGNYLVPQLSTIRQSAQQMAVRGVKILLEVIEEGSLACHETVPFGVLRRESTCAISEEGGMRHA